MILLGALIYRIRGMGDKPFGTRQFWALVFAAPFAWVVYDFYKNAHLEPAFFIGLVIAVLVATTLAVLTGHGNGIDLGTYKGKTEPETVEPLILWLRDKVSPKTYDVILLSLTGFLITAPAGLVTLNPLLTIWGVLKGPAYLIADYGMPGRLQDSKIEAGELLTGAVLWGALFNL